MVEFCISCFFMLAERCATATPVAAFDCPFVRCSALSPLPTGLVFVRCSVSSAPHTPARRTPGSFVVRVRRLIENASLFLEPFFIKRHQA